MKAYSQDLREHLLRAVDDGYPRAEVVQMFVISFSTLKRYIKQRREEGHVRPKTIPDSPSPLKMRKGGFSAAGISFLSK